MDLKLLAVFDEIYKTRSVSRAGENLGLAQTSVSLALELLRLATQQQVLFEPCSSTRHFHIAMTDLTSSPP